MPDLASSSSAQALPSFASATRSKRGAAVAYPSSEEIATLFKLRETRWRPGLGDQPKHSEIFADTGNASGVGVAFALASDFLQTTQCDDNPLVESEDRRQILWVQETRAIQRSGRPYLHGLPSKWQGRLIHAEAKSAQDALFALEEGLKCRDLACVVGEIVGNPRSLDFTASRRLSLTAEKHGVPLWLVRLDAEVDLSSARMRWHVESAPSENPDWNRAAPGSPQWKAELFRARAHPPGKWIFSHDNKALKARKPDTQLTTQNVFKGGLGKALARKHRHGSRISGSSSAADTGYLVRTTVGRSLAAAAGL
ncbi:MAG: recA-like protein [Pseudomonadota bacterium]